MTTVEQDPRLNSMLLQNRIADLDKVTNEFNEFVENYRAGVSIKILDMASLILAAEPNLQGISFTLTAGEYNDNTYEGFSVSSPSVMINETMFVKSKYGDYTVDPHEWFYADDCEFSQGITDAIESLANFVRAMRMFLSEDYGSKVRLIIDSNGLSDEQYD